MGWLNRRKVNFCKHSQKALSEWRQPTKRPVGMYCVTEQQEITSSSLSSDTQPCQCKHLVQVITNASGITAGGTILFLALWKKNQQESILPSVKAGRWSWQCQGWYSQSKEWMLFQPSLCDALLLCFLSFIFFGFSYLDDDSCPLYFLICNDYPTQLPKYSNPYRKECGCALENWFYFR